MIERQPSINSLGSYRFSEFRSMYCIPAWYFPSNQCRYLVLAELDIRSALAMPQASNPSIKACFLIDVDKSTDVILQKYAKNCKHLPKKTYLCLRNTINQL